MRKIVFIAGACSISLFIIGQMLRTLHIVGGGITIAGSMVLFAFVFVPVAAVYYYKRGK